MNWTLVASSTPLVSGGLVSMDEKLEKVRTSARAFNRLVQRTVETAGEGPASVAVHHLAAADRAERLAAELRERLPKLRELYVSEVGAAIGAHVGPGAVGVVVVPAPEEGGLLEAIDQPGDEPAEPSGE